MFLTQLNLTNYKNIQASQFNFKAPINCFVGRMELENQIF